MWPVMDLCLIEDQTQRFMEKLFFNAEAALAASSIPLWREMEALFKPTKRSSLYLTEHGTLECFFVSLCSDPN